MIDHDANIYHPEEVSKEPPFIKLLRKIETSPSEVSPESLAKVAGESFLESLSFSKTLLKELLDKNVNTVTGDTLVTFLVDLVDMALKEDSVKELVVKLDSHIKGNREPKFDILSGLEGDILPSKSGEETLFMKAVPLSEEFKELYVKGSRFEESGIPLDVITKILEELDNISESTSGVALNTLLESRVKELKALMGSLNDASKKVLDGLISSGTPLKKDLYLETSNLDESVSELAYKLNRVVQNTECEDDKLRLKVLEENLGVKDALVEKKSYCSVTMACLSFKELNTSTTASRTLLDTTLTSVASKTTAFLASSTISKPSTIYELVEGLLMVDSHCVKLETLLKGYQRTYKSVLEELENIKELKEDSFPETLARLLVLKSDIETLMVEVPILKATIGVKDSAYALLRVELSKPSSGYETSYLEALVLRGATPLSDRLQNVQETFESIGGLLDESIEYLKTEIKTEEELVAEYTQLKLDLAKPDELIKELELLTKDQLIWKLFTLKAQIYEALKDEDDIDVVFGKLYNAISLSCDEIFAAVSETDDFTTAIVGELETAVQDADDVLIPIPKDTPLPPAILEESSECGAAPLIQGDIMVGFKFDLKK